VKAEKAPVGALPIPGRQAENDSHSSIERAVRGMNLSDLAALLVGEILVSEISDFSDVANFPCPACQPHWQDLLVHSPAASTLDEITWSCSSCKATGTRWSVESMVLASPGAVRMVMATLVTVVTG